MVFREAGVGTQYPHNIAPPLGEGLGWGSFRLTLTMKRTFSENRKGDAYDHS